MRETCLINICLAEYGVLPIVTKRFLLPCLCASENTVKLSIKT